MNEIKTLNPKEAADFLQVHYQTLLGMIKNGDIPAAKFGRSYVLLKDDLVDLIRSRYPDNWCAAQVTTNGGNNLCHFTVERKTARKSERTGWISPSQTEKEYESLLKRKTERKH
jgi:excisionase family DNA binding protein|tara:strand:- start:617 stop:958 length:342 start_codon:yes stop_codon:yes gene_type:complete